MWLPRLETVFALSRRRIEKDDDLVELRPVLWEHGLHVLSTSLPCHMVFSRLNPVLAHKLDPMLIVEHLCGRGILESGVEQWSVITPGAIDKKLVSKRDIVASKKANVYDAGCGVGLCSMIHTLPAGNVSVLL
jgi:hypothetical protein